MSILQKNNSSLSIRITKRLLGKILLDGGFISPREIETAIERQKQTNEQLGKILVDMGLLNPVELKAVLSIQKDLASLNDAVKVGAGVRMLLGQLLVNAKKITMEQLDLALLEQQRTGKQLGEILVHQGLLLKSELEIVLAFQRSQRNEASGSDKLRLGELLVATGQIAREQLEEVLKRQKLSNKKIGELLIEARYVLPHQIDQGLALQQKLVTAALITALSMASMIGAPTAQASSPVVGAKISIAARVLERTSVSVISQAPELIITNADIQRGYADVPLGSRINAKTNNPAGYLLVFDVLDDKDGIIKVINVQVGGKEVIIPPNGGWVPQPFIRGGGTVDVSYRFILSKNVQPGTYSWPIILSAGSL